MGAPLSIPTRAFNGFTNPSGVLGESLYSEAVGRYSTLVKAGKVFYTSAVITAPVIFSTAAQLGPMLFNKVGSGIDAHILALSVSEPSTATAVAGALGWAVAAQPAAPTTATTIASANAYSGGPVSGMAGIFSTATVVVVPAPLFLPLVGVGGAAITVGNTITTSFMDIGGSLVLGPGYAGYVCTSATLTAAVMTIGLLWAELPA